MSVRYRMRYARGGTLIWFSHLEIVELFRKAVARSGLKVEFSNGFSPSMKISFSPPLPVGYTSGAEYADLLLSSHIEPVELKQAFARCVPKGFDVLEVRKTSPVLPSLSEEINIAEYFVGLSGKADPDAVQRAIEEFSSMKEFPVVKPDGRTVDAVRFTAKAEYIRDSDSIRLLLRVINGSSVKPDLFIAALLSRPGCIQEFSFHRARFGRVTQSGDMYEP